MDRFLARLRRLASIALVPLLVVAITDFVVDVANPFGIGAATEAAVARLIQREIVALGGDSRPSPGQKSVTVVLINREFVQDLTGDQEPVWPLPVVDLMRRVIQPVLDEQPAAVFIDLAFPKAPRALRRDEHQQYVYEREPGGRSASDVLGDQLAALDQDPSLPPIFLSDIIKPTRDDDDLKGTCEVAYVSDDLLASRSIMALDLRSRVFGAPGGAKRITLVNSGVLNGEGGYQLAPIATGPARSCAMRIENHDIYIPSPAIALLQAYCPPEGAGEAERRKRCDRGPVRRLAESVLPAFEPDSNNGLPPEAKRSNLGFRLYDLKEPAARNVMELRWRTNLTPETRTAFSGAAGVDTCLAQFRRSPLEPLIIYGVTLFKPLEQVFAKRLERPCMAIDTITPGLIKARMPDGRAFGEVFLKDRIVLIGVDLTQAGDHYESPVNGVTPGVYVHATAIENLLTRGDRFSPGEATVGETLPLYLVSAIAVFLLRWLWGHILRAGQRRWPPLGELVLAPLAYLFVAMVVSLGLLVLFDGLLPPIGIALPLTKIAMPIIAVHLVLFADWGERLRDWILEAVRRRGPSRAGGS